MKLKERVILHVDANNFYASVESVNNPHLLNKPVAVSGNAEKRTGIILAKNQIAKQFGVCTGEAIWQAKQKCPDLVCVSPNFSLYENYSMKLRNIYSNYTDRVEPFGIDECWLDVTSSLRLFKSGEAIAQEIKERVKNELGITVSVGVSFCKLFAKLGSDMKKPDAITIINRQDFKAKIYPLPITDIIGIGKKFEERFHKMNVNCLGDITNINTEILNKKFGIVGVELKEKLMGFDYDEVKLNPDPIKSVGNGTTTIIDISSEEEVSKVIMFLCEKISSRLRKRSLMASSVGVCIKTSDFKKYSHDKKMDIYTCLAIDIHKEAMDLLKSFWNFNQSIRAIRVKTFNLIDSNSLVQDSFFSHFKKNDLAFGVDFIKNKYGNNTITFASNLNNKFLCIDDKLT